MAGKEVRGRLTFGIRAAGLSCRAATKADACTKMQIQSPHAAHSPTFSPFMEPFQVMVRLKAIGMTRIPIVRDSGMQ